MHIKSCNILSIRLRARIHSCAHSGNCNFCIAVTQLQQGVKKLTPDYSVRPRRVGPRLNSTVYLPQNTPNENMLTAMRVRTNCVYIQFSTVCIWFLQTVLYTWTYWHVFLDSSIPFLSPPKLIASISTSICFLCIRA